MFARKLFCGSTVPQRMFSSMHISSTRQAQRLVPSLCSMLPSSVNSTGNGLVLASLSSFGVMDAENAVTPALPMDPLALQRLIDFISCVQLGGLRLLKVCSGEPFLTIHRTPT
jgi:hypothetical protein